MPGSAARSPFGLLDLLVSIFRATPTAASDEVPRPTREADVEVPVMPPAPRVRKCSAWCGWSSMASDSAMKRDVAFAKWLGLSRLDVIVNDHSASRRERPFDTYVRARIFALCRAASDAGLELSLLSWLMPHSAYIDRAAGELGAIMLGTGAASVCFDAEEPYTRALDPLPYEAAAQRVADKMQELPWGVTAIGYPNATKLKPLVTRASFVLPQCYSTNSPQTAAPEVVAPRYFAHWRSIFPSLVAKKTPLLAGLAAYNQEGITGHTAAQAIRAAFLGAEQAHAEEVVWWSLSAIRNNKMVANAIREVTSRVSKPLDETPQGVA